MNKETLEAKLIMEKAAHDQKQINEFDKLRPSTRRLVFKMLSSVALVIFLIYLFPEIPEQPAIYVLLILLVGIEADAYRENVKTNKRIDLLHKILLKQNT